MATGSDVSDDQDQVLRHLRPGHRPHAAEEGTDQNAGQADENPISNCRLTKRLVITPTP